MLRLLAKSTLHRKVIVKAASVLQMKFLAKAAYQSEIPFKMHGKDKICQATTSENPGKFAEAWQNAENLRSFAKFLN